MARHVTSLRRLAFLLVLTCCEVALRAITALVDRAARTQPEGDNWQPDEDAR